MTSVRIPAARNARALRHSCPSKKIEGAGKAGCRPHPWPACNKKSRRQSPQVRRTFRPSLRNGVTAYTRSPRGAGLIAPVAREIFHELDPSVGRSGPRDFAVRLDLARLATSTRPSHPAANTRDDRVAPLWRLRMRQQCTISDFRKAINFPRRKGGAADQPESVHEISFSAHAVFAGSCIAQATRTSQSRK
jgi:hypothetical protein